MLQTVEWVLIVRLFLCPFPLGIEVLSSYLNLGLLFLQKIFRHDQSKVVEFLHLLLYLYFFSLSLHKNFRVYLKTVNFYVIDFTFYVVYLYSRLL